LLLLTAKLTANTAIVDPATNAGWNSTSLYVAFLFYFKFYFM
jgi:hypothetical protein